MMHGLWRVGSPSRTRTSLASSARAMRILPRAVAAADHMPPQLLSPHAHPPSTGHTWSPMFRIRAILASSSPSLGCPSGYDRYDTCPPRRVEPRHTRSTSSGALMGCCRAAGIRSRHSGHSSTNDSDGPTGRTGCATSLHDVDHDWRFSAGPSDPGDEQHGPGGPSRSILSTCSGPHHAEHALLGSTGTSVFGVSTS